MSFVNVFGGTTIQPSDISYTLITLNANITLSWPTQFPDPNSLLAQITTAQIVDVMPTAGGFSLTMPPANQVSVGQTILINNISGINSFTLRKNDGTLLTAVSAQTIFYLYLIDNTTIGGTWRITPWGLGLGSTVTSVAAAALTTGLTITGSPITTAGTLNFSLSPNLVAVSNINTTGIQVVTVPGTWASRSLVAGSNIAITNPDGVAANPTISLNTALTGITSLTSGNVQISGQTITTNGGNLDLILAANGTGNVQLANNLDANGHTITGVTSITSTSIQGGNLALVGNAVSATNVNGSIWLESNGTGSVVLGPNFVSSPTVDAAGNFTQLTAVTSGILTANTSINVNSLILSGNTISSTANSDINVSPNGTGVVNITSNLNMNTNSITNTTNLTATNIICDTINVQGNPIPIPRASATFDGTTGIVITGVNIVSPVIKNAAGNYTLNFTYAFPNANFIVVGTCRTTNVVIWDNPTPTSVDIRLSPLTDTIVSVVIFY